MVIFVIIGFLILLYFMYHAAGELGVFFCVFMAIAAFMAGIYQHNKEKEEESDGIQIILRKTTIYEDDDDTYEEDDAL